MKHTFALVSTVLFMTPLLGACVEQEEILDDPELASEEQDVTTGTYTCGRYVDLSPETSNQLYNFSTTYVQNHNCSKVSTVPYTGAHGWFADVRWGGESLPPDGRCTGSLQIATLYVASGSKWVAEKSSIEWGRVVTNSTTGVQYCEHPRALWILSPQKQYLVEGSHWLGGDRRGTRIEFIRQP